MTNKPSSEITSTLARTDDGGVQVNFTIPKELVSETYSKSLAEIAKGIEVSGFRKGNAPLPQVEEKVGKQTVIEKALSLLLPQAFGEAITKFNLKPAIYPKFTAAKIADGEDWQIKADTCELPEIKLGDYKKVVSGALAVKSIWIPNKAKDQPNHPNQPPSREEKEQLIIKTLLNTIKLNLPQMLVNEEVDMRLSDLLARLEKLGLTLESYLASLKKDPQALRNEYGEQAKSAISLELILNKIAEEEKITVSEADIDGAINAAAVADTKLAESLNNPERRRQIAGILRRRAALDFLTSLS